MTAKKEGPRRQKAYELLHALCEMVEYVDEVKTKGPYGKCYLKMKQESYSENELIQNFGFDKELIEFLKTKVK